MKLDKTEVVNAMINHGGAFETALASCIMVADDVNLQKIKETWPEIIQKYESMAEFVKRG
jgi:hypothetical protein